MPLNLVTALADLRRDPEAFLKRYPIQIVSNAHGQQVLRAQPLFRGNATRKTSVLKRTVDAHDGLQLHYIGAPTDPVVTVFAVQMIAWAGAPNWVNIPAPAPGGPALIVTTPLTGCCFAVDDQGGGAIRCAHAQHAAGQTSAALRTTMGTGGFAGIYGHQQEYDGAHSYALIVGAPDNGHWRIFAQRQSRNAGNRYSILGVDRIF